MLKRFIVSLLGLFALTSMASEIVSDQNVGWYAYRDLDSNAFSKRFNELSDKGYRMIDVDAYSASGGMRYAMMWQRNDGRAWAERRDMTNAQYRKRWAEYRDRGFRPTDVEAYQVGNKMRYAGIWVENRENIQWSSWRNMKSKKYGQRFKEMSDKGYMLVDMEAYKTPNGTRYAAIWYKNTRNIAWAQLRNLTRERYQREVDSRSATGFRMVDFERYKVGSKTRYAAIWHKDGGPSQVIRTNRSKLGYANHFREYRDDGYRPIDFERDGNKYGAIWIKVNPRLADYKHRRTIDRKLKSYLDANNIPGLSAAIYHNGQLVYRGGTGIADGGKVAHGETIYPIASISKVVGGTLLGRLENRGRRQNGQSVDIKGSDRTRKHLPTMPSFHRHTLRQLASHTACISHYNTSPGIANQTAYYSTQQAAAASIWNGPLLNGCSIGASRSYSTHAFTFLGAAIEAATGRTVPQLVREELAAPFNLPSLRVMYTSSSIPSDYDRAAWYANGSKVSRSNNSWKAFGGGIEASAKDLARFGWLTGAGKITTKTFRDNTLLVKQPNSSNGYAWGIGTQNDRRRIQHNGSWTGARSQLSVWPNHSLSIALLTNQKGHDGLGSLANEIADLIL